MENHNVPAPYRAQEAVLSRSSGVLFQFLVFGPSGVPRKVWILRTGTIMVEPSGYGRMRAIHNPVKEDVAQKGGKIGGLLWLAEQAIEDGAILNAIAVCMFGMAFKKKQARWCLNVLLLKLKKEAAARKHLMRMRSSNEAIIWPQTPTEATGTDK